MCLNLVRVKVQLSLQILDILFLRVFYRSCMLLSHDYSTGTCRLCKSDLIHECTLIPVWFSDSSFGKYYLFFEKSYCTVEKTYQTKLSRNEFLNVRLNCSFVIQRNLNLSFGLLKRNNYLLLFFLFGGDCTKTIPEFFQRFMLSHFFFQFFLFLFLLDDFILKAEKSG